MNDPAVVAALAVLGTLSVLFLVLFLAGGANLGRFEAARRAFARVLRNGPGAQQIVAVLDAPPPRPEGPPKPSGAPLRLLTLLQRDGRLIDFLLEDIQHADEATIGAGVKEIHRQCQEVLREHLVLEPILSQPEGADVVIPAGFDPSAIRLTGNVTGQPPFKGTLQHHGWRVREIKLAAVPEGHDEFVLAPAEVVLP
jgi:hypothetical protein